MRIQVTELDINSGSIDCLDCPIARAIRRSIKYPESVFVGFDVIRVGIRQFKQTRRVKRWRENYDNHQPVQPFSFNLKV